MKVRVNWKQGIVASDKLIRVHNIDNQKPQCQLEKMKEYSDFPDEKEAQQEIRKRGYSKYKHCKHCWNDGGAVINI